MERVTVFSTLLLGLSLFVLVPLRPVAGTVNVTVGVVVDPPFVFSHPGPFAGNVLSGIVVDLLSYISEESSAPCASKTNLDCGLNFEFALYQTDDDVLSALLAREIQLAPSLAVVPRLLKQGVHFVTPWGSATLAFVARTAKTPRSFWFFVSPLSWQVWLSLACGFVLAAISIALIDQSSSHTASWVAARGGIVDAAVRPEELKAISFRNGFHRAALALTGIASVPPRTHPQRLAHMALFLLQFFVVRAYLAKLTATQSIAEFAPAARTWTELVLAGQPVAIVAGSDEAAFVMANEDPTVHAVLPLLVAYNSTAAAVAAVRSGEAIAVILESYAAEYQALLPPCELTVVLERDIPYGLVAMGYLGSKAGNLSSASLAAVGGGGREGDFAPLVDKSPKDVAGGGSAAAPATTEGEHSADGLSGGMNGAGVLSSGGQEDTLVGDWRSAAPRRAASGGFHGVYSRLPRLVPPPPSDAQGGSKSRGEQSRSPQQLPMLETYAIRTLSSVTATSLRNRAVLDIAGDYVGPVGSCAGLNSFRIDPSEIEPISLLFVFGMTAAVLVITFISLSVERLGGWPYLFKLVGLRLRICCFRLLCSRCCRCCITAAKRGVTIRKLTTALD